MWIAVYHSQNSISSNDLNLEHWWKVSLIGVPSRLFTFLKQWKYLHIIADRVMDQNNRIERLGRCAVWQLKHYQPSATHPNTTRHAAGMQKHEWQERWLVYIRAEPQRQSLSMLELSGLPRQTGIWIPL